ncbi:hypothetical protein B566_EDAN015320 [Ephemera danica]|nr:hypothetical protein B566_EDAN015320 [Ephemera danica]
MKESTQKGCKRSASLDESPGSSDTWRLLHELKGKITKTVEEKLCEIKNEKKKENPKLCATVEKHTQPEGGSPSHRSTVPATPESTTPEPEPLEMDPAQLEVGTPVNVTSSPQRSFFKAAETSFRNKIRPKLSELRQRRKKVSDFEGSVSMSDVNDENKQETYEVIDEEGVESAFEVQEEDESTPTEQSTPARTWSFIGHLGLLCKRRDVQTLLVWPLVCALVPVPSTLRDMVLGALLMHILHRVYQWFWQAGANALEQPLQVPDYRTMPILQVPAVHEYQHLQKYEKVRKRAMWNESAPRLSFYHQRIFDISGCTIKLLPEGLARKSKKYPIAVVLGQDSRIGMTVPDTFKDTIEEDEEYDDEAESSIQEENSEDDAFYLVTSSMVEQNQLYLFARTDREKDDWVRRLVAASKVHTTMPDSELPTPSDAQEKLEPVTPVGLPELELHRHISRFLQQVHKQHPSTKSKQATKSSPEPCPEDKPVDEVCDVREPETAWFNALLSRVLFDVELTVSELDLGVALPVVHRTSAPHMDERGLWVDLDISYEGSASISVETKLNLVKLTKADSMESSSGSNKDAPSDLKSLSRSPMFDSDMEDSAESSSDEDVPETSVDDSAGAAGGSGGSMGKMLFRMATKITTSRYFQQASEIRYIRRAMEEMSNTKVMVKVELKGLVGNPELRLAAKAKLGERLVTLSQVTDWIEGKLCVEFQKVFVLPNMDEIIIPVMNGKLPN